RRTNTRCTVDGCIWSIPPMRAGPSLRAPQPRDPVFDAPGGLVRTRPWTARAIPEPGVALGAPAPPPLVDRRPRHIHLLGHITGGPADLHPLHQLTSRAQRQLGVSVIVQQGLPSRRVVSSYTPTRGGPSPRGPHQQRPWALQLDVTVERHSVCTS